jgi:MFS family permease
VTDSLASPFRHRAFTHFWFARVATTMAYQMLAVAVGWQIYALTNSALDLGLIGLVQFLPSLVLVLVSGHVADRYDRRTVVGASLSIEAIAVMALAVLSFRGSVTEQFIFTMVALIGSARAFEAPTLQALLPGLVPAAVLPRAVAASASANQTAVILGPAAGGLLYVLGPTAVYATSASLFVLASILVWRLRIERTPPKREPATLASIFAGIAFIRGQPAVLGAISLDLFAVLLGGATALLPIYARDILGTGPWGLGLLRSAPALGALSMALYFARRPPDRRVGRTMFAAVAIFGVATMVFAVSTSFALSLLALVVLGASDMISVVIRISLVQLDTPDAMRGRVSAVNSVFIGTSNQLGEFESGVTAALLGTVAAVLLGGVGTLFVVLLWMRLFPTLLHRDRLRANIGMDRQPSHD